MGKYVCTICGYEYDPEQGDLETGIRAGTLFDAISRDWLCPVCGASKDMFEEVN